MARKPKVKVEYRDIIPENRASFLVARATEMFGPKGQVIYGFAEATGISTQIINRLKLWRGELEFVFEYLSGSERPCSAITDKYPVLTSPKGQAELVEDILFRGPTEMVALMYKERLHSKYPTKPCVTTKRILELLDDYIQVYYGRQERFVKKR